MQAYERLEHELARWAGFTPEQMVVCSSGTAALVLALEAMQLPLGSRVLTPDYAMIACPRAVTVAGLVPEFVDCKSDLTLDVAGCYSRLPGEAQHNHRISAVMPVHVYGRSCDMSAIADLAGKYDLRVIEDLAEAHGLPPHPNTDAACWSFYRNKIVAGEEGGAVAFKDRKHAHRARMLRSLGFTADHDYTHIPRGHNYRLANCLAELILTSLVRVKENVARRWNQYDLWDSACPVEWMMPLPEQPWVYSLRIPGLSSEVQDAAVRALRKRGIEARHGFKPCRLQTEYGWVTDIRNPKYAQRTGQNVEGEEWESDRASREVIYMPVDSLVTNTEAQDVFDLIALMVG